MGKGGKGGGGGGGGSSFQVPAGLSQAAQNLSGVGQYATSVLNPLAAMTNWATNLATGGAPGTQIPTYQSVAIQAGPQVSFGGQGLWSTSFDPTSGLVTYTNTRAPQQTFTESIQSNNLGDLPQQVIDQWGKAYQQNQLAQAGATGANVAGGGGQVLGGAYGDQLLPGVTFDQVNQWYAAQGQPAGAGATDSQKIYAFNQAWGQQTGQPVGSAGPQLSLAWQDIQAQQAATGQMPGIEAQTQAAINQAVADQAKYAGLGDVQQQQAQQFYDLGGTQEAQAQQFFSTGQVQEAQAQALYGVGYNELSAADQQVVDANALVQMTTTGQGLFPAQSAMIEQARQSEETQLASTLGGAGLGRSTQLAQLTGAEDLAAAATAGQLQQGNIQAAEQVLGGALGQQAGAQKTLGLAQTGAQAAAQTYGLGISQEQAAAQTYGLGQTQEQIAQQSYQLSQAAQKIGLAGQELLSTEQAQLTQELQNITVQSVQMQQTLWNEAMGGYGAMGQMLQSATQAYGYSLQGYQSVLSAMEAHNQMQAGAQQAAMSADAQGTSSLFKGLGSLFGSSGLGGLLGGGGGAAAGGAIDALGTLGDEGLIASMGVGGAAAGGSGIVAGIGGAVTALFCEVAQEVYGFDNPKWERFRKWLLFRGPRWFLAWYGHNARHVAGWLKDRPRVKWLLSMAMDAIAH